eukprot:CAMPEP_0194066264 /NCGR_PEP_ID=MMETSP0009_2-20130614/85924_1 /TAXON_ID=210454 /ORGANISM="Grammatophora oceanica, Strain CCMP 410" /LENGTH=105 /DNA_ID=CAMNT_0038719195 /DNA_START=960 /DNA_END=1278 /DNA_ORIENTATION=+
MTRSRGDQRDETCCSRVGGVGDNEWNQTAAGRKKTPMLVREIKDDGSPHSSTRHTRLLPNPYLCNVEAINVMRHAVAEWEVLVSTSGTKPAAKEKSGRFIKALTS